MLICLLYFLSTSTLHHSHRKTPFPLAKVPYCVHFLSSCLYCTRFFFCLLVGCACWYSPYSRDTFVWRDANLFVQNLIWTIFRNVWQTDNRWYLHFQFSSLLFFSRNINNQKCKHFIHLWQLFRFVVHWNACTKARILKNHQKNTSLDKIVWVSACQIIIRFVLHSDFFPCSGSIIICW